MTESIHFKIRRKRDGMYSGGGSWPRWSKTGKIWKNRGGLANHLNLVRKGEYVDCEVVMVKVIEIETDTTSVTDYINGIQQRKQEREDAAKRAREERLKEERRQQYLRLKDEFEEL